MRQKHHRFSKLCLQSLVAGALTLASCLATAQGWPSKPVRVVVPFPPGGASDMLARTVAQKMSEQLGQTFVIENKPGAASTIGIAEAAKTPADGYTLLLAAAPYVITQYVYPKLSYDVRKDFVPLGLLQTTPTLLVVNPALGINTLNDFLKLAKSKPGQISYATPGGGMNPMLERHELTELRDVVEDALIGGVKDMRPVDMHDRAAFVTFGEAVSANVIASLEHLDIHSGLSELARNYCP